MPSSRPRRLGRTVKFTGRVFRVEQDRVRLPNTRVVLMDIVRHRGSVVFIPQPSPAEIILVRQYRYAIGRWIWELPAGSLDPGESPLGAVRRECEEEIGLTPRRVTRLGTFYPTPGFCDERMIFYRCERLTRPARRPERDLDELLEPRVFTIDRVRSLISRGEILDMKTVVGLGLVDARASRHR